MDRVATEVKLAKAKADLSNAMSQYPLVVQNIVNAKAEVAKFKAGVKAIDEIAKELKLTDEDIASLDVNIVLKTQIG